MRYSSIHDTFTTSAQGGKRLFGFNHMPVVEDEQARKALAFLREGRRLRRVHEPYSFLSFYKVIESQLESDDRISWIEQNLSLLDGEVAKRVAELQSGGVDVNDHLYKSGRCAVAHASVSGKIVDPDIPADRRRIAADLVIISALAEQYIREELGVPDELDLYKTRDRLAPLHGLMTPTALAALKAKGKVEDATDLGKLNGIDVSVSLWPDQPVDQFQKMALHPVASMGGAVKFVATTPRETIALVFVMNVANGLLHTVLDEGGIASEGDVTEQDVEDYTRYLHSVIGNRVVEVSIEGEEPVACEIVIPRNIIPRAPEEAVAEALAAFRSRKV